LKDFNFIFINYRHNDIPVPLDADVRPPIYNINIGKKEEPIEEEINASKNIESNTYSTSKGGIVSSRGSRVGYCMILFLCFC
jgi:hypothetical protein